MGKFKIAINDSSNIRDILQIAYNLADEQLIQAQNEMDKLANSTRLEQEVMDAKQKYAKAMNDYLSIKDKAIGKKMEIAKLLSDIMVKSSADGKKLPGSDNKGSFDFKKIKQMVDSSFGDDKEVKKIEIKK